MQLTHILCTHHHDDHIGGAAILQDKTGCWVIGPSDSRISNLEQTVKEGDQVLIGPYIFEILDTPGHTNSHIVYFLKKEKMLFSGDLLFCGGCGRIFEGTAQQMWESLLKIKKLPDDTLIYPGHEYTLNNLKFALTLEPDNLDLQKRIQELSSRTKSTIPSTIECEKKTNPFLRANEVKLKENLQMSGGSDTDVFAKIRELKDSY